jgi:hypothetical protein
VLCDAWPAMFSLPVAAWTLLDELTTLAAGHRGRRIYRQDLVAALVMRSAPTAAEELQKLFWEYIGTRQFEMSPLLLPTRQYMLRLPAPVSLRLDELVARSRELDGERVRRRDVVAALVSLRAPPEPDALDRLYEDYLGLHAADAALPGQPVAEVLSRRRPLPGVRRLERVRTSS